MVGAWLVLSQSAIGNPQPAIQMTVLPIVGRELTVACRRAGTYWLRFWVAAGALGIFFILVLNSTSPVARMGREVFDFMGYVTLGFCLLAGVFLTADSLSAEKREGTLGLLFLTDLKGYDVVLGKLAASSLHAIFGLLAVFPVLALPLLTGGLSAGEFWRTMLVFCGALYFSLGLGMLVSAASHDGRQAMGGTFAAITLLAGVLPLLWQLQFHLLNVGHVDFLLWTSPVYAYLMGFDASYLRRYGALEFWTAMGTIFSVGTGCIVASGNLLPRSWQKSSAADPNRKRTRFHFITETEARWRRPPLQDKNPFFWLALGDREGQSALTRMLVLLGLLWAVTLVFLLDHRSFPFAIALAFGLHFAAKVLIASESGRRFHQDRQSGALELLLATPLRVEDIVTGQREALRKQFHRAIWLICLVNLLTLIFMVAGVIEESGPTYLFDREEIIMSAEVFLGGAAMLWLDASALCWIGMWRGLNAKKYQRAVVSAWGQVMLPPWLAVFLFFCIGPVVAPGLQPGTMTFFILLWFGLGAAVDLAGIAWAREKLLTSFRATVSERSDR